MELIVIENENREEVVLLDEQMQMVKPVYEFLRNQRRKGRAFNTIKANGRDLKVYYDFLQVSGYAADKADTETIVDYIDYLKSHNNVLSLYGESARTAKSINRMLSTIRSFYQFYEVSYGAVNPIIVEEVFRGGSYKGMLSHVRNDNRVKQSVFKVKEVKRRIHLVDENDAEVFYRALPTWRDRLLFKMLYLTGARIQEILDLEIGQIPFPDTEKDICVLQAIKSKGKTRDLYVPMSLIEEMDHFIIEERSRFETKHNYIFVANKAEFRGLRLKYRGVYEVFKNTSAKTGIDLNFHDLRHSFISHLTETGMDISLIRIIAGHEHIATSQQYIHISGKYLADSLAFYWKQSILTGGADHD